MKKLFSVIGLSVLSASLAFVSPASAADEKTDTVKVGVLHSTTGTMAISETSLRDMLLFAFDEINKAGGVLGKKIEPVVVDGASEPPIFAEKATQLLEQDKVAVTFGCWTSSSRVSVKPIFEKDNGLLFYPVQYEGEEQSKNIFYTAEAVNQQAIPAVDYLLAQKKKKFYLIGTDYIYPQTTNLILFKYLQLKGIPVKNIGGGVTTDKDGHTHAGKYTPFSWSDYQQIVADIKQFAASGNACVINTINGDSNVAFFKEIASAGLTPAECPVVSFSLAEDELRSLPTDHLVGELGCWTYFMSIPTPANQKFLKNWSDWLGAETDYPEIKKENRVVDSPMVLSYNGVYLWKAAVEKAKSFDVDKVRKELESGEISFNGPGGKTTMNANHHTTKNVYIGTTLANGQFKIVKEFEDVKGDPWQLKKLDEALAAKGK